MIYDKPITKAQAQFEAKINKIQVAYPVTIRLYDQPITFAQFSFENKVKTSGKTAPQPAKKLVTQPAKINKNLPAEVKKFIKETPKFKKAIDFETLEDIGAGFETANGFHFYARKP